MRCGHHADTERVRSVGIGINYYIKGRSILILYIILYLSTNKMIKALRLFKKDGSTEFKSDKVTPTAIIKDLLLDELKTIDSMTEDKGYRQYKTLIDLINNYADSTIPSLNSKVALQSYVRCLVRDRYGAGDKHHKYLKAHFSMTPEESKGRQIEADAKVEENNMNQAVVPVAAVDNLVKFLKEILIKKWDIIAALMLAEICCGARLIELLSDKFTYTASAKEGWIVQSDVAKNKTGVIRPVTKPIIFLTVPAFLELIGTIRSKMTTKPNDTNVTLSNRYSKRIAAKIKTMRILGLSSSHDLRRIYANYSYSLFGAGMSLQVYLKRALGHDNFSAAANYSTVRVN